MLRLGVITALCSLLVLGACAASDDELPVTPGDGDAGAGGGAVVPGADGGDDYEEPPVTGPCLTRFRYAPKGPAPSAVAIAGEWKSFAPPGDALTKRDDGTFEGDVELPPGLHGYKLLVDGDYRLDPASGLRKYVGGIENSAVRVSDCREPRLTFGSQTLARPAPGKATYRASVKVARGNDRPAIDPKSAKATVRGGLNAAEATAAYDARTQTVTVDTKDLKDGKYTILVELKDKGGKAAKPLRLVFWVEPEPFDWNDALIYMIMVDRFVDGDPSSNAKPTAGVDPRADFKGGDFQGITKKINDGTFDKLGVRALWMSPFHENPAGSYPADGGVANVVGYHGYWPVKARAVDARFGGAKGLREMVDAAHAHGIRILQDFVVNHVHKEHEYVKSHPEWFRTGCVCGTENCGWTEKRLECLFADYIPDVNWSVTEASEQFSDDAVWWVDEFDLDGLRVDAVKHVEDASIMNLAAKVRGEFEANGTRVFMTGETAMGWSDCGLACNANEYGTISRYMGPYGVDGQFDFVLHHAVPYRVFAYDQKGMIHADYWVQASASQYPKGSIMTPYIDSHDTARFVTMATYRGQPGYDIGVAGNKWSSYAGPPPDAEPLQRLRLALAWLYAIPGAPLLYYGDEYGEWGGADPNNRAMWRGDGALGGEEQATLAFVQKLGVARRSLPALRRGEYRPLHATEQDLVFARQTAKGEVAIVALTKNAAGATIDVTLPITLGLAPGAALKNHLGGDGLTVGGDRSIRVVLGGRGAAILAP